MARLLIVDDDPRIRTVLRDILEQEGHELIEAEDGIGLPAIVAAQRPAVVLLDVIMPRVDGLEALKALKADPRTRSVPVIMLTARDRPADFAAARALGARDYITKPWESGEVALRVQWAIDSSASPSA